MHTAIHTAVYHCAAPLRRSGARPQWCAPQGRQPVRRPDAASPPRAPTRPHAPDYRPHAPAYGPAAGPVMASACPAAAPSRPRSGQPPPRGPTDGDACARAHVRGCVAEWRPRGREYVTEGKRLLSSSSSASLEAPVAASRPRPPGRCGVYRGPGGGAWRGGGAWGHGDAAGRPHTHTQHTRTHAHSHGDHTCRETQPDAIFDLSEERAEKRAKPYAW
jgi:hypothetical protein